MQTLRVTFDDSKCKQSPDGVFQDVTPPTSRQSFDPILFTDPETGRTQVSHLLLNPLATAAAYTDDDGATWVPSQGAGIGSGIDHQSIGGGPYHAPLSSGVGYKNAVYYCSQDIAFANCARSDDGGLTYGPAVPIYDLRACAGLHGHVKVAPDGTVYVPNSTCQGKIFTREQAVVVSEDNGITWEVRPVPGSVAGDGSDPSVAIDKSGRVYLGYVSGDRQPAVAVSEDRGRNWKNMFDVGAQAGIKAAAFPAAVAGDDGRAAVAYYATRDTDPNSVSSNFRFNGTWYLYVAHTYNGGQSWVTVNATPNDPIQRGGIYLGGGGEINRNLLDFFDADSDDKGRMIVGFADGCVGACAQAANGSRGNSYIAYATIARQTGGRRLLAAFDDPATTAPGAPRVTVTRNGSMSLVSWSHPETGGLPITGYEVYRSSGSGAETLLARIDGSASQYTDSDANPTVTYSYRVVATNSMGGSCGNIAVKAAPAGFSCIRPGVRVVTDKDGDQLGAPANPDMDIQWVSLAEPYYADGSQKLEFTLKVASLATMAPNRMWRITWKYPDAPAGEYPGFAGRYYVGMNTDASGTPTFEYGLQESLVAVVADASPANRLGAADPESSVSPDGTIRIVISTDKVGLPKAGDLIGGLVARAYPVAQDATLRSDTAADSVTFADAYRLVGNASCQTLPKQVKCFEENNGAVTYSSGWHTVVNANASGGQYRYRNGNQAAALSFKFRVADGATGALIYRYATSAKGGAADVYIDGVMKGAISFNGPGTEKNPAFGASARFDNIAGGEHTFELRNARGGVYIDQYCLESSYFTSTSSAGPGGTDSATRSLGPAAELLQTVNAAAGAQAISVLAQGDGNARLRIVLIDPLGSVLRAAESVNGVAVLDAPVSATGAYVVKVVNLGLTATEVWSLATPWQSQ